MFLEGGVNLRRASLKRGRLHIAGDLEENLIHIQKHEDTDSYSNDIQLWFDE